MPGRSRRLAVAAALALGLATAGLPARAQGGGDVQGAAHDPLSTPSRVGLESDVAGFDLGGQRGTYLSVAPVVDYSPNDDVLLRLRLPLETLYLSGQDARTAVGDLELRAKYRLYADGDRVLVFAGIDDQLPTGPSHLGLGGGDIQLTPYVTGGYKHHDFIVYLTLGDVIGVHAKSAHLPVDYVDPSTDHETHEDVGLFWNATKKLRLGVAVTNVTVLVPSMLGQTLFTSGASVVYSPSWGWKLSAIAQVPISGDRRYDEKLSVGIYRYF